MKRKPKIKRRVWRGWLINVPWKYKNAGGFVGANFSDVQWGRFTNRAKITVEWEQ